MSIVERPPITEKARENRLRRKADRLGYALRKNRVRDPDAPDFGVWWLVQVRVWTGSRWELVANPVRSADAWIGPFATLDEVEARLTS